MNFGLQTYIFGPNQVRSQYYPTRTPNPNPGQAFQTPVRSLYYLTLTLTLRFKFGLAAIW